MESSSDDDFVILTCTNPNPIEAEAEAEAESESKHKKEILISTTDILSWDLHAILCSQTLQIHANRNRPVSSLLYCLVLGKVRENLFKIKKKRNSLLSFSRIKL